MDFQFDIQTMIYLFIFGNLFIALLITAYRFHSHKDIATTMFIQSKWLQVLYWCSILIWDYVPHFLSIPLSNALILGGGCLEIISLLMMMGMMGRKVKLYYLAITVCSTISFCIIAVFFNHSSLRIASASLWVIMFVIYPAHYLTTNKDGSPLQRMLGLLYYCFAAIMLVRTAVALIGETEMNVFTANLAQHLYYLGMYLLLTLGTAGFILLSNESSYETLKRIATYDEMTGILSRRAFIVEAHLKLARAAKKMDYVTLLLMDLDHFKKVNDTYGHDAGDRVLKAFALTTQSQLGNGDLFGRVGGEEFAVLFCGLDEESSEHKAEILRKAVMNSFQQEIPIRYTVSIGMITVLPTSNTPLDALYKLTDKALYRAKQEGRNRVVRAKWLG